MNSKSQKLSRVISIGKIEIAITNTDAIHHGLFFFVSLLSLDGERSSSIVRASARSFVGRRTPKTRNPISPLTDCF